MSLLKCPDCGNDVSSSAPSCPHCGRPSRKPSSRIELSGILVIAAVCAGALIWRLSSRSTPPVESAPASVPGTSIAQPSREIEGLSATIGYNRKLALLRVENRDTFTWSHCQLSLNAHGISSGYTHELDSIAPGIAQAALVGAADLTADDGRRFDPANEPVATLEVACDTPTGPRSYGGSFTPQSPAGG
ncbi:MAG: hypothetical protein ACLPQ6_05485 [Steroidobacteraceae bacterium]